MSDMVDKYLQARHEDAAKDFNEDTKSGEDAGKKEDDTIGAIHDRLAKIEKMLEEHLITKKEANEEETKTAEQTEKQTAEQYDEDKGEDK